MTPQKPTPAVRHRLRAIADVLTLAMVLAFIASYFPARVMFSATTTNGGDISSHVYSAFFLRESLLPAGKVIGWCPGNYAGFPLFQFYFPLPFLAMVALSALIPLVIAFKLVTVSGVFLLPVCSYLAVRLAAVPFPGPALAAVFTLPFLFMEANSMWGGNIPSTLAGEFTFSISLAVFVLFLGTLRYTVTTGKHRAWNGLLVAIGGLCHGYTLLWAGLTSLFELAVGRRPLERLTTLVAVHGLAILLMAAWLVPLLAYSAWTTGFAHIWHIQSLLEIVPQILWPSIALAVATTIVLLVRAVRGHDGFPVAVAKFWAGAAVGLALYLVARSIQVVDIRFLPFLQVGLGLVAASGLGFVLGRLPAPEVWPLVALLLVLPWVDRHVEFIPAWVDWNYSGFEEKPTWPLFTAINRHLRGDFRDPRVVYEHSDDHEVLGTVRAFENLPLFSGRSTLEGLYMQASPSAPFVFYIQSEISTQQSCPFGDFGCARFDLARGVEHLRMFNVSHFIARSAAVKDAAAKHGALRREARFGDYEIYEIGSNSGRYAVPLRHAPQLIETDRWQEHAYQWFKAANEDTPIPFYARKLADDDRTQIAALLGSGSTNYQQPPQLTERLEVDSIAIEGCRPGHPVLVRISYHPRWEALGGERIWVAGPGFMLVFPKSSRLELRFGDGPPVVVGRVLSAVGGFAFMLAMLPWGRRWFGRVRVTRVGLWVAAWISRIELAMAKRYRPILVAVLAASALLVGAAAVRSRVIDSDTSYRMGQQVYDDESRPVRQRLEAALPYFRRAQRLAPLSNTAIHSTYYESIILYRLERWEEAEATFARLMSQFPEAHAAPEALYHIGNCRSRRGLQASAIEAWEETRRRYPTTEWARYAAERIAEQSAR